MSSKRRILVDLDRVGGLDQQKTKGLLTSKKNNLKNASQVHSCSYT